MFDDGSDLEGDLGLSHGGARRVYTALCLMASCRGGATARQREDLRDYQEYLGIADHEAAWLQGVAERRDQLNLGKRKREKNFLLDALIDMAVADERVDPEEEALLMGIARKFRMPEADLRARLQEALERSGATGRLPQRRSGRQGAASARQPAPTPGRQTPLLGGHEPSVFDSDTGGLPELGDDFGDGRGLDFADEPPLFESDTSSLRMGDGFSESQTGSLLRSDERRGAAQELGHALDLESGSEDSLPLGIEEAPPRGFVASTDDVDSLFDDDDEAEDFPELLPDEPTEELFGPSEASLVTGSPRASHGLSDSRRGPFGKTPSAETIFDGAGSSPDDSLFGGHTLGSSEEMFGGEERASDEHLFGTAKQPSADQSLADLFGDDEMANLTSDDDLFGPGATLLGASDDSARLALSDGFDGDDFGFDILEDTRDVA